MSALTLMGYPLPVVSLDVTPEKLGGVEQRALDGSIRSHFYRARDFIQVGIGSQPYSHATAWEVLLSGGDTWDFLLGADSSRGVVPTGNDWTIGPGGLTVNSGWATWVNSTLGANKPSTAIIERNGVRTVRVRHSGLPATVSTWTNGVASGIDILPWFMGLVSEDSGFIRLGEGMYTAMMLLPDEIDSEFARELSTYTSGLRFGPWTGVNGTLGAFRAHASVAGIVLSGGSDLRAEMSIHLVTEAE